MPGGLKNYAGNNCYINVAIQIIGAVLKDNFGTSEFHSCQPPSSNCHECEFLKLFTDMLTNDVSNPQGFVFNTLEPIFNPYEQDDAYGVINHLLSLDLVDTRQFEFFVQRTLICTSCDFTSQTTETNTILNLLINNIHSLIDAIEAFQTSHESIKDYTCQECKFKGATVKTRITSLPKNMMIQLKRFKWEKNAPSKLQHKMFFPLKLKLIDDLNKLHTYKFKAAIFHVGTTVDFGHYKAVCEYGDQYYMIDDTEVKPILFGEMSTAQVYILRYEKEEEKLTNVIQNQRLVIELPKNLPPTVPVVKSSEFIIILNYIYKLI